MKPLTLLLTFALVALQYKLWFGEGSIPRVMELKNELAIQVASNERAYQRNAVLEANIAELKRGAEALEERARGELGMVMEGEEYFHIID